VNPGDSITVDIHNVSGKTWSINVSDAGHWTYSDKVTYASSESSAEWIQEAPSLESVQTIPAPVGDVQFGPTSTYTVGGTTKTIAAGEPTLIDESPEGGVNEATTSALAGDGQSFDVCVYAQTCAAP
jgi:Peptidase A4 family